MEIKAWSRNILGGKSGLSLLETFYNLMHNKVQTRTLIEWFINIIWSSIKTSDN